MARTWIPKTEGILQTQRIVVFGLALLAACDGSADPAGLELSSGPALQVSNDRHREDPVCSDRVTVVRTVRADAGVRTAKPDSVAAQSANGTGGFQASFGASAGGNGLGAQSWTTQSTNVECGSWSIGRQSLIFMKGSGTGSSRSETVAEAGADGVSRAGALSETRIAFELQRSGDLALGVQLDMNWLASQEPNATWTVCSGATATLARTTVGDQGTVLHRAVFSCDGSDPAQSDAFQWKGQLKPGTYELTVGGPWAGAGMMARSTGGAAAAHAFASGDWKFQFELKEL